MHHSDLPNADLAPNFRCEDGGPGQVGNLPAKSTMESDAELHMNDLNSYLKRVCGPLEGAVGQYYQPGDSCVFPET